MTVRIENGAVANFGTFAAAAAVTHFRIKHGSITLLTRPLSTAQTIAINREGQFAIGAIDLTVPEGEWDLAGARDLVDALFDGVNSFEIELLTSSSVEVSVSGYASVSTASWTKTNE